MTKIAVIFQSDRGHTKALANAVRNGVNATPKFYVNGRRIDGHLPLDGLTDAVRAEAEAT